MKKVITGVLAVLAGWGLGGSLTAQATPTKPQYSAARSQNVQLVWRKAMKQQTYLATKGARYSQHLGWRYGRNADTAQVVWVTDAHEKLFNVTKQTAAVYDHVHSRTDAKLQGWIWRGYLKATKAGQVAQQAGKPTAPTTPPAGTDTPVRSHDKAALTAIADLGHGAQPNADYMDLAAQVLTTVLPKLDQFDTAYAYYGSSWQGVVGHGAVATAFGERKTPNANQVRFQKILKKTDLTEFGFGAGRVRALLFSTTDTGSFSDLLADYYSVDPNFTDTDSITSAKFFAPVKLGVATKRVAGQKVLVAIATYPTRYQAAVAAGNN